MRCWRLTHKNDCMFQALLVVLQSFHNTCIKFYLPEMPAGGLAFLVSKHKIGVNKTVFR